MGERPGDATGAASGAEPGSMGESMGGAARRGPETPQEPDKRKPGRLSPACYGPRVGRGLWSVVTLARLPTPRLRRLGAGRDSPARWTGDKPRRQARKPSRLRAVGPDSIVHPARFAYVHHARAQIPESLD